MLAQVKRKGEALVRRNAYWSSRSGKGRIGAAAMRWSVKRTGICRPVSFMDRQEGGEPMASGDEIPGGAAS